MRILVAYENRAESRAALEWAVETAERQYGVKLHLGELLSYPEKELFDVVTMLDLVEHLPNPREALEKARRLLKPGGILVVVTPNVDSFAARLAHRPDFHARSTRFIRKHRLHAVDPQHQMVSPAGTLKFRENPTT